ncbi:hypothetical protein [Cupriavidus taiwanensis]|uniref:hypothetical protein n=1 Tax=Cupriavidus taiwanensis TaxID=164546 RepID=UPI0011AE860E|nr:hypothetical protein [Cupriavidus taiwanensis]
MEANEPCHLCAAIKANPGRDYDHNFTGLVGRRNPIGSLMQPLFCEECGTEWRRIENTGTGSVRWEPLT